VQNPLRRGLFIGLLGLLAAAPAIGQPPMGKQQIRSSATELPPGPLVTVKFPGGSLRDYIGAVQKAAAPADVNVVPPPDANDVKLPEISLKGVTVRSALEAVQWAVFDNAGSSAYQVYVNVNDGDTSPVYAVYRTNNPTVLDARRRAQEHGQQQIEVFSIRELIEPRPGTNNEQANAARSNVLGAIETALRMQQDDGQQPPDVKLHQETSLLIVRGTPDQINIVRNVLARMRDDAERQGASTRSSAARDRERTSKIRKLTSSIELQKKELEFRQKRMTRQRELVEKGQASTDDVATAELEAARAQTMLSQLIQELEDVQKETAGQTATEGGESKTVAYDMTGIDNSAFGLVKAIVEPAGGAVTLSNNTLSVQAPEEQQRLVQALFRTIRKGDAGAPPRGK
jgi:hypothetical protein